MESSSECFLEFCGAGNVAFSGGAVWIQSQQRAPHGPDLWKGGHYPGLASLASRFHTSRAGIVSALCPRQLGWQSRLCCSSAKGL
jgi:hypothetical protein